MLTQQEVREAVASTVEDIISDFKDEADTDRERLIERLDDECDTLWGQLVYAGRIVRRAHRPMGCRYAGFLCWRVRGDYPSCQG